MISQALLPGPRAPPQISSAKGLHGVEQNVCLALLNMDFHCAYCQSLSGGHWQPNTILSELFVVGATTHIAPSAQYFHLSHKWPHVSLGFRTREWDLKWGQEEKPHFRPGQQEWSREAQVPDSFLISIAPGHAVISALPL